MSVRMRPACIRMTILTATFFFLSVMTVYAQDIRPLVTEGVSILPRNSFQFQLGEDYYHGFNSIRTGENGDLWQDAHVGLRWGVSKRVELDVDGMPYKRYKANSGRTDAGVGDFSVWGKFLVWQGERPDTAVGFRLGVKLPNTPSNKDFGTNQTDFYAEFIAGKSWGGFKIWTNLGIGILDSPYILQSQDDIYPYGVAFSYAFTEKWAVVGEGNGFISRGRRTLYGNNHALRIGFLYTPVPNWTFDAAGAISTGRLYGDWSATAGLSYRFKI